MTTVIILGGGVAGMSAAHELVTRGYTVRVFERQSLPGGKARSVTVDGTGTDGRKDLPGEHGFRFFPRFYRHIIDTMERIPVGSGTAAGNLVQASREEIAIDGTTSIVMSAWFPRSIADIRVMLAERVSIEKLGLTAEDQAVFASRVWQLMTSCRERSLQEYERLPWTTFLGADQRSEAFRRILVGGLTRSLIAATPKEASTDVGGTVLTELFYALARPGMSADRLLDGPTNDVWLAPWLTWLRRSGVDYHLDAEVTAIEVKDRAVAGVTVREHGVETTVTGDYYIGAVPVERMAPLVTDAMVNVDPILGNIRTLAGDVRWMTGLQFYLVGARADRRRPRHLHRDAVGAHLDLAGPVLDGLRPGRLRRRHRARHPLGRHLRLGRARASTRPTEPAHSCRPRRSRPRSGRSSRPRSTASGDEVLTDAMKRGWYLDRDIAPDGRPRIRVETMDLDAEPLLVNKAGRWNLRPTAHTGIANFFLASDYVRTNTNLATMEAANEAARRAVNGILDATNSSARECAIWPIYEPWAAGAACAGTTPGDMPAACPGTRGRHDRP